MTVSTVSLFDNPPLGLVPLDQVAVRLHPDDDVIIARIPLQVGTIIQLDEGSTELPLRQFIPAGHKIAVRAIATGEPIRRYGQVIGFATQPIAPGEQVHTQNLAVGHLSLDYAVGVDAVPVQFVPDTERRTFMGYKRPDGRVGTRNMIAVIASVNCSAHTVREIAHAITPDILAAYPNVDGVIPIAHNSGCGMQVRGADQMLLQRTLSGMANNANIGGYIIVGLGCETNQISEMMENFAFVPSADRAEPIYMTIQDTGGIRKTIAAGIGAVHELLPEVNRIGRTPQPLSELILALQCGGSDGWSGVTANPALGLACDEIVRQGGTVVLSETPEIYGAEHLLIRRASSPEVAEKLLDKVHWWEEHARRLNIEIDNNPSVGNKVGGLTTIYEKSLGAVAKAGNTPLMDVLDYAEPIKTRGFVYMDTPGYDPVSATGQVAGGATLIVFTTGRGSVFGFKPSPSIKVASNTTMYERMIDDMDLNAGRILEGVPMQQVADELLDLIVDVASGQPSKSEGQGVGESEFTPWNLGGTL